MWIGWSLDTKHVSPSLEPPVSRSRAPPAKRDGGAMGTRIRYEEKAL